MRGDQPGGDDGAKRRGSALAVIDMVQAATAFSMSVSAKTTMGLLPPSSRETLLRLTWRRRRRLREKEAGQEVSRGEKNGRERRERKRTSLARRDATREADLADKRVLSEKLTGLSTARDDLNDAVGETSFLGETGKVGGLFQ
jgi:hypothetical protein